MSLPFAPRTHGGRGDIEGGDISVFSMAWEVVLMLFRRGKGGGFRRECGEAYWLVRMAHFVGGRWIEGEENPGL